MTFDDDDQWDNDPALPMTRLLQQLRTGAARACAGIERLASEAAPGW